MAIRFFAYSIFLIALFVTVQPLSAQTGRCQGLLECAEQQQVKTVIRRKGTGGSSAGEICKAFKDGNYTIADLPSVLAKCDRDIHERAYQALDDLKKHEAIAPFIKGLSDKDEIIRVVSAVALFALKYNSINLLRKLVIGIHDGSITIESVEDLIKEYEGSFHEMASDAKETLNTKMEEVERSPDLENWGAELSSRMEAIAEKADPVMESLKQNPTINKLYERYRRSLEGAEDPEDSD